MELDLEWQGGRMKRLAIRGAPHAKAALRYGADLLPVTLDGKGYYRRTF
jgi:hypothetical protein